MSRAGPDFFAFCQNVLLLSLISVVYEPGGPGGPLPIITDQGHLQLSWSHPGLKSG